MRNPLRSAASAADAILCAVLTSEYTEFAEGAGIAKAKNSESRFGYIVYLALLASIYLFLLQV